MLKVDSSPAINVVLDKEAIKKKKRVTLEEEIMVCMLYTYTSALGCMSGNTECLINVLKVFIKTFITVLGYSKLNRTKVI
jgi:hypothetical protein